MTPEAASSSPSFPDARPAVRWPAAWVASTAGGMLGLVWWLRAPVPASVATACGAFLLALLTVRAVQARRGWALAATLSLAVAVVLAMRDSVRLQSMARDLPRWSTEEREQRATQMADAVAEVASTLRSRVAAMAGDTAALRRLDQEGARALGPLAPPLDAHIESALLVFRGGTLIARTGQTRTRIAPAGPSGVTLVEDPFYASLVARAIARDGHTQVVAVALITAVPPADRFARALTQTVGVTPTGGRTIVESPDSTRVAPGTTVQLVPDGDRRLARVRALPRSDEEGRQVLLQEARARTAVPLVLVAVCLLVCAWSRPARTVYRLVVAGVMLAMVGLAPLNALSNVSPLFDAVSYYSPLAGPWSANVAALLATAALGLATVLLTWRSGRVARVMRSRGRAGVVLAITVLSGPWLVRELARGIALPATGAPLSLWVAWQLALALVAVTIVYVGTVAGRTVLGTRRGLPPLVAPALAVGAAVLAPVLWRASGTWPAWYPILWGVAVLALAFTRRNATLLTGAAVIAGAAATTVTWGATVRARMDLAQHDLARLTTVDENAYRLLRRFALALADEPLAGTTADDLLRRYAASDLAQAGYPARLTRWDPALPSGPVIDLPLAAVQDSLGAQATLASMALSSGTVEMRAVEEGPITVLVAAIPAANRTVTTIAVPPRTAMVPMDPFAALAGIAGVRDREPPYRLSLAPVPTPAVAPRDAALRWRRRGDAMHGDGLAPGSGAARGVHVEVDLRGLEALVPRGALLSLFDVLIIMLLWLASALADGAVPRWLRQRRQRFGRSYRVRLSAALLAFFIAPATLFAGWAAYRLQDDDRAARELLVREALRTAASDVSRGDLTATANSVGSPLFVYRDAELVAASDSLLHELAPLGRLLPVSLDDRDFGVDDQFTARRIPVGRRQALVGYRRLPTTVADLVVVTPARGDEFALDARRADLWILLLFTVAVGALAAIWLSGVAARALARPVGALQEAAQAIAGGGASSTLGEAPASEFAPVYRAFDRMADDLSASRTLLEAAQRRTEAVLQHVASGVVAMRLDGSILLANPRAVQLLDLAAPLSVPALSAWPDALTPIATPCRVFLHGNDAEQGFDVTLAGRQLRGRLTRLPAGAVLTLDDLTELASAQRVLAWGEMARQVAHEIKNPLTPIRLGVQHLRRAFRDQRPEFGDILETNVSRILAEIDHLDAIARAFSKYGTAPEERAAPAAMNVPAVVQDVLALERLGDGDIQWLAVLPDTDTMALGQADEWRDVLLNLLENARLASARTVTVTVTTLADVIEVLVADDGQGIPDNVLSQVFEPHFSTRTSGSGLGLAISRRVIESWGGAITLASTPGAGTVVRVQLRPA